MESGELDSEGLRQNVKFWIVGHLSTQEDTGAFSFRGTKFWVEGWWGCALVASEAQNGQIVEMVEMTANSSRLRAAATLHHTL